MEARWGREWHEAIGLQQTVAEEAEVPGEIQGPGSSIVASDEGEGIILMLSQAHLGHVSAMDTSMTSGRVLTTSMPALTQSSTSMPALTNSSSSSSLPSLV